MWCASTKYVFNTERIFMNIDSMEDFVTYLFRKALEWCTAYLQTLVGDAEVDREVRSV